MNLDLCSLLSLNFYKDNAFGAGLLSKALSFGQ